MGFMDFIKQNRAKLGNGLMRTGGFLRKVGDVSAPVIRKIGEIAGSKGLQKGIGIVGAALAPFTDGASLGVSGLLNKGLSGVANVANRADQIASGISGFGNKLQTVGQTVSGLPQVASKPLPCQGRRIIAS